MRSAGIWRREGKHMPITVKTFATLGEAASALQSDRGARFLAGGTLVMRAINEGDVSISTVVRSTDRGFAEIRPAGARDHARRRRHHGADHRQPRACVPASGGARGRRAGDPQHGDRRRQPVRPLPLRRLHGRAARARRDGRDAGRLFGPRDAARGVSWRVASGANGLVASVTFNRPRIRRRSASARCRA